LISVLPGVISAVRYAWGEEAPPQYWIILTVIRSLYDHTAAASRLERERSAKFTVTLVRPAIKSHSKIPGS
jgi:hypothetical protein